MQLLGYLFIIFMLAVIAYEAFTVLARAAVHESLTGQDSGLYYRRVGG